MMEKYASQIIKNYTYDDKIIRGLSYDSRKVKKDYIFFAIKGSKYDGNDFVQEAIENGACIIISEKDCPPLLKNIPWIKVSDVRKEMAMISSNFYKENLQKITLIGITGTNGKTTTTHIVEAIFNYAQIKSGVIGTIGYKKPSGYDVSMLTTPESTDIHSFLSKLIEQNIYYAAMEVSSHSIAQKRVYGLNFAIGAFMNLTRDHLDFHITMDNYFETKKRLFCGSPEIKTKIALINCDDPYGLKLYQEIKSNKYSFGLGKNYDFCCLNYQLKNKATYLKLRLLGKEIELNSSLIGLPNLYNITAATAIAYLMRIKEEYIKEGIENFKGVKGRLEQVNYNQNFLAIIDYAHTDDAITNLLKTVKMLTEGKVIIVFGCGGDRDKSKRELMGKAAAEGADYVIITSDNPRSEDPEVIARTIENGIINNNIATPYEIILDREKAIFRAVQLASSGDAVVLAGKGHEDYQIIGSNKIYFDERKILKKAIEEFKKI